MGFTASIRFVDMPQSPITSHPQGGIKWYENEPTMLTSVLRVLFASCSINHHQHLEVEAIGSASSWGWRFPRTGQDQEMLGLTT